MSHRLLLHKAKHYGINNNILSWIRDFLSNRSQQVVVEGKFSTEVKVTSGVPQGSVLGPLLFLIFINDLPECVKHSTTRLFADDCVLYRRISTASDASLLQDDLTALQEWENTWLMEFHPSKCQVVNVTNKQKPIISSYTIHNEVLESVRSAKYLGLHVDAKLNFNTHIDVITKKANSTRAFLSRNFHHCSKKVKDATYTTYIRPSVEYASSVWDPHTLQNIKKVEQVQRSSARYVTGKYGRDTSVTEIIKSLKWTTLENRRLQSRLGMLYRIRNNLVDIKWSSYLMEANSRTRGHGSRFQRTHCNSQQFAASFFPRTIRDWNCLKFDPAASSSLDAFKKVLSGAFQ